MRTLRRFNRSYTQRIGVLDDHFLGRDRPLAEARLLFEIGVDGASVGELRARLGLDAGYLSRLLRSLEGDGLIALEPDPDDARRRVVRPTAAGRDEWAELDRRSDELAAALLAPLSDRQRAELDRALVVAERLLAAATVTFDVVDPRSDDAIASMSAYFDELDRRFPGGFDPGDTLVADAHQLEAPHGTFVVVRASGGRGLFGRDAIACGGIQTIGDRVGEIKRMWVADEARGLGIGPRLLADLEARCAAMGHEVVRLDTNSNLPEAVAMYRRAGYVEIDRYNDNPYPDHFFEKRLPT